MSTARIYQKGQITIPNAIRDAAGLKIGDRVVVAARGDEVVVRRPLGVLEFTPPRPRSTDLSPSETRHVARTDRVGRRSGSRGE